MRYFLILAFVFVLLASPYLLDGLRQYEGNIAGTLLREIVERESDGYYTVEYGDAYLTLLNAIIEIEHFQLIPQSSSSADAIPINTFKVEIPTLSISLESLLDILLFKELTIKSIRIVDPQISMVQTDKPTKRRPFSLEAGDLYALVSQYLKLFKIDYFQIADGAFNYDIPGHPEDTSVLAISRLNFEAKNFLLDSASADDRKVFYTDAIELIIHDQSLFLTDSIHQFSFGKFHLSTADGLVRFEDIRVAPREDLAISFYENPELLNIFDIEVPSLHLSGVDFLMAYANNKLHIDSIALEGADILINDEMATEKKSGRSIAQIMTDYFDEVYVRSANITNAQMDLHLIANGRGRGVKLENANIRLGELKVDTTFFDGSGNREFFSDIELSFDNHMVNMPDSIHKIFVKRFKLSSFDNIVEIDSFRSSVRSDLEINGTSDTYELYLPSAGLTDFDWHAVASRQQADFGKFYMDHPEVMIHKYTTNTSRN
ncbi:MAG: hypothetical protein AAGC88_16070, partial [Bacteroidota bacterium]